MSPEQAAFAIDNLLLSCQVVFPWSSCFAAAQWQVRKGTASELQRHIQRQNVQVVSLSPGTTAAVGDYLINLKDVRPPRSLLGRMNFWVKFPAKEAQILQKKSNSNENNDDDFESVALISLSRCREGLLWSDVIDVLPTAPTSIDEQNTCFKIRIIQDNDVPLTSNCIYTLSALERLRGVDLDLQKNRVILSFSSQSRR